MSNIIDVHITIDAKAIISDISNPSKDPKNPTSIGHQYSYMVVSHGNLISGNGTGDLVFSANVDDKVRFSANTTSNNFDDATLIYNIQPFGGSKKIMNHFIGLSYGRVGVFPSGPSVLPANQTQEVFAFYQGVVTQVGNQTEENYGVWFVLYTRDTGPGGDNEPQIHGYYKWDPKVIINKAGS